MVKGKREAVVVIKPRNSEQRSEKTKEEIKNKLDPIHLSVQGIRNINNGGVILKGKDEESIKNIQRETTKN